jgi:hypothetical protein
MIWADNLYFAHAADADAVVLPVLTAGELELSIIIIQPLHTAIRQA